MTGSLTGKWSPRWRLQPAVYALPSEIGQSTYRAARGTAGCKATHQELSPALLVSWPKSLMTNRYWDMYDIQGSAPQQYRIGRLQGTACYCMYEWFTNYPVTRGSCQQQHIPVSHGFHFLQFEMTICRLQILKSRLRAPNQHLRIFPIAVSKVLCEMVYKHPSCRLREID